MAKEKSVALADSPTAEILKSFLEKALSDEATATAREAEKSLLLSGLERTVAYIPLTSEVDAKSNAITGFVREYFSLTISEMYPQISTELQNLTRTVNVVGKRDYHEIKADIEVPVFAHAVFGKQDNWEKAYQIADAENRYTAQGTLSSKMPCPTIAIREKAKEAIAYCYDLESRAMTVPVLGDLLLARNNMPRPSKADLWVLWKPKEFKMNITKITDNDPILALAWENRMYLVATWDAKEEEPYKHYLAEFKL